MFYTEKFDSNTFSKVIDNGNRQVTFERCIVRSMTRRLDGFYDCEFIVLCNEDIIKNELKSRTLGWFDISGKFMYISTKLFVNDNGASVAYIENSGRVPLVDITAEIGRYNICVLSYTFPYSVSKEMNFNLIKYLVECGVYNNDNAQEMLNTQELLNQANSDQFIIAARSCCGKSWFGLKSIMEVYRNSEVDLGGAKIMKVTFNYPATIVEWDDGTKTVVKARDDEPFDHEKGLAMAIAKKALGNNNNYYMVFKDAMYEPVEKKPKDWNTNYTEYFTRTGTDYKPVGITVDRKTGSVKIPEFVSGKYYKPKKTYLGAN